MTSKTFGRWRSIHGDLFSLQEPHEPAGNIELVVDLVDTEMGRVELTSKQLFLMGAAVMAAITYENARTLSKGKKRG